ncbi:hypothetical protein B0T16DRAFT_391442 [Cercophora newfieldiana]|uniref:Extracellular membrane protein CFEM domain-containing protein n=1 Tax=Cercophora newfieldiana TaxID=92897 RepID=A0AA39Y722_9PEZI|nr:hypothetical protein B0T16DRAFT_391442 [Cercophora newfieldiana]
MKPLHLTTALTALLGTTTALNDIFIPLPYPECNACLDTAANSCPGNYQQRSYAECICAGEGSKQIVGCVGTCDAVDTQPMGAGNKVVRGYYSYCIMFFPELCTEAVDFVNPDFWQEHCGAGSSATGGSGSGSGTGSGSAGGSGEEETATGGTTPGLGGISPTGTVK